MRRRRPPSRLSSKKKTIFRILFLRIFLELFGRWMRGGSACCAVVGVVTGVGFLYEIPSTIVRSVVLLNSSIIKGHGR
jgi:phage shock protein PspC (stress-responsive transcriptional regulator)